MGTNATRVMPLCLTLQYFDRLNGIKTKPSVISNVILTEGVSYSIVVMLKLTAPLSAEIIYNYSKDKSVVALQARILY